MGRKRKIVAVNGSAKADKVKSSDASISLTPPGHKFLPNTDNSSAVEPIVNNVLPISSGSNANKKKLRTENEILRRSGRLKSFVLPGRTRGVMKHTVEHVNLTDNENEKEEEETEIEKVDALPVLNEKDLGVETQAEQVSPRLDVKELSLDEKVNYLVRMVDEFKPKVFGKKTNESPSPDFSYKSLYIQTQKKYEALMEEHYDVVRRLEFARGQIAAYEKMKDTMGGASREVILVSDLGKLTGGGGANVHQTALNCTLTPSVPVAVVAPDAAVVEVDKNPNKKKTYNKKKKGN